ncbi:MULTISPECIES: ribosome-associated translation inhibitor RaiA [unclassified Curtobacterium]|jgi:ribosomal subunit interface protein|uniref:ribosome hibernation-promoting factor, HPF/YfiA family n=1 Tax=unclassified Curtobacterium TaxID=257496 RepID=UPI000F471243|nr:MULTISPECIES: ribosome-associated translation inhibitor RaiA [unclassified Curtobacterium]NQW90776.1 ribosome-associated translation inhibitor RaiA [Curtobacterium sp. VKM Ac-2861]MBF4586740.1 ribosome-associated translation inhibitor RaiA [Curtobacterium sp. VKM Ac-2887]ROS47711.1 ribosomal subunit interface protein [Curtobacterium sp. PhB78]TCL74399.1 ribosomal subunit interface protein [Curtobacterium sp. PhB128]TCL91605.1 ribosomal subunit interface protein [Curtobacterium sp. PhB138]
MDVTITGRNVGVTDRFRTYVEQKSEKIDVLADRALAFEVRISRHHEKSGGSQGEDRIELTLIGPGPLVRAESAASDKYAAFDLAFARIMERLRRARDRRKVHRGRHRPTSVAEAAGSGFDGMGVVPADGRLIEDVATGAVTVVDADAPEDEDDEVYSPVVIRHKVFEAAPMTVDDALYFMELVGHDFYLFVDAETHRPSVVYRRKGWDYGVIGIDDQTGAAASVDAEPAAALA